MSERPKISRRLFLGGAFATAIVAAPIIKHIPGSVLDGISEFLGKDKNEKLTEKDLETLNSRTKEICLEIKTGWGVDIDLSEGLDVINFETENVKYVAEKIKSVYFTHLAVLNIKKCLQIYPKGPKDNPIMAKYLSEISFGANLRNPNYSIAIYGTTNTSRKKFILNASNLDLFSKLENDRKTLKKNEVMLFRESTFHHELAHLFFDDISVQEWALTIYDGKPPQYLFNVEEVQKRYPVGNRPVGFARSYGLTHYGEDIAATYELLIGVRPISEDMRTDEILIRKLKFLKTVVAKIFDVDESYFDKTGGMLK